MYFENSVCRFNNNLERRKMEVLSKVPIMIGLILITSVLPVIYIKIGFRFMNFATNIAASVLGGMFILAGIFTFYEGLKSIINQI